MDERTARAVLRLLAASPGVRTLDLTGGAPEMNPHFRMLVREARRTSPAGAGGDAALLPEEEEARKGCSPRGASPAAAGSRGCITGACSQD